MTRAPDLDAPGPDFSDDVAGEALPSFAVLARFRRVAGSAEEAETAVREELAPARGLFDDARVEPQEPDGRWAVDVRFVVTSTDNEHAVDGVDTTLRDAGVAADEVWVAERLS